MIVAGFGFRNSAELSSLQDALSRTGSPQQVAMLATVSAKADHLAFQALAHRLSLPVAGVEQPDLAMMPTETQSARSQAAWGTGSVAEAAALAAAGPGAQIVQRRVVSKDRLATCALAQSAPEGDDQ